MRKLAVALFGLAACGGGSDVKTDAPVIKIIDAAIDAHPDSPPPPPPIDAEVYDFTCLGKPLPTTAADPITISGTSETISTSGISATAGVTISSFKTGTATALDTVTTDTNGNFTSGNLVTGGVPLDGYVEAVKTATAVDGGMTVVDRTTFVYPDAPLVKNLASAPVLMINPTTFNTLSSFAGATQDDTMNGALVLLVTDCAGTPINGATVSIKQGTADVGMSFDLGSLSSMAAGTFFVFNVPDGATDVSASYMQGGTNEVFRTHSVMAHKKDDALLVNGSLTITLVRPGP